MSLNSLFSTLKGGAGSGNIGHAGIPGHRGGSAPKNSLIGTTSELSSLSKYSGEVATKINHNLRFGTKQSKDMGNIVNSLDSLFEKNPPLSEGTQAYRLTKFTMLDPKSKKSFETLSQLSKGDEFLDKGFVSTTLSKGVIEKFKRGGRFYNTGSAGRNIIFTITIPKGNKAIQTDQVSRNKSEKELLLPRDQKFKVVSNKPSSNGKDILIKIEAL